MKLINSIKYKKAKIAIIGLGYVGLPLLINFLAKNSRSRFRPNKLKLAILEKENKHFKVF